MKNFKNIPNKINKINNKINKESNEILDYLAAYKFEIWLVILSVIAFLIHYHLAATLNLGNDEAHYYVWSLHLSPGYLDDAPLAAYCIYFFTHIFGKSELTVRLTAVIFSFFDGFLIYYLTYLLFKNKRASFFAFLFFLCSPIFGIVLSVMMLPDTPLLFFSLLFLISFYIAANKMDNSYQYNCYNFIYNSEKPDKVNNKNNKYLNSNSKFNVRYIKWWVIAGIFLGLSFLSKYTAALIPPSALLYLLFSNKNRYLLKTIYPYFTLLIAVIVFSPVIYWNLVHNFISFKFQLSHGFSSPISNSVLFFQNWLEQFIAISPLIYIILFFVFVYFVSYILFSKNNKKYILKKYNNNNTDNNYNNGIVNKYSKCDKDEDNLIHNPVQKDKRFNKYIKKNNEKENEKDIINESILFALSMSIPVLVFFIINGYSHRILFHWPDIGYLSAFPLAGFFISSVINKYMNLYYGNNSGKYSKIALPQNKICKNADSISLNSLKKNLIKSNNYDKNSKLSVKKFLNLFKLNLFKFFIYFALFVGFFMSMILYYQIYYNFIPVSNIISFIDKEHRLHKGGIFKLIPHIPGKAKTADITDDLFGWTASAKYLKIVYFGYKNKYPSLFLLTHHYAISDELVFYGNFKPAFDMKPDIYNISGFLNQYDIWQNKNKLLDLNGKDAMFVMDNKYMINPVSAYLKYFKSIKFIGRLDIYRKFMQVREFYIYFMKDFNAEYALRHMSKRLY